VPPSGEGRWALLDTASASQSDTEWSARMAEQLLTRYGIVSREVAAAEALGGGFSAVYEVFRSMEERGRIRRGYFAAGVGAVQFALPAALDLLRSLRQPPDEAEGLRLSATDPANAYGTLLRWPAPDGGDSLGARGPTRSAGAQVVIVNGRLGAWLARGRQLLLTFLPEAEPEREIVARAVAGALADAALEGEGRQGGLLITEVNGLPVAAHPIAPALVEAGFVPSPLGYQRPRETHRPGREPHALRHRRQLSAKAEAAPSTTGSRAATGVVVQDLVLDEEGGDW
jgi:ATP-dependent Lhr-like helicase